MRTATAANLGIALANGTTIEHVHFASREAARWPTLIIDGYTP